MLDIKFVRENPDIVKENIKKKFQDKKLPLVDEIYELDIKYRESKLEGDNLRASKNQLSSSIGALVREAEFAQSPADFINKLHVSLKECNETLYWLELLRDTGFITEKEYESMSYDCNELLAILIASIKTTKKRNSK